MDNYKVSKGNFDQEKPEEQFKEIHRYEILCRTRAKADRYAHYGDVYFLVSIK